MKSLLILLLLTSSALAQISTGIINSVTVSGTIGWTATIANVQPPVTFWINGVSSWSESVAPYEYKGIAKGLDTTKLVDGQHSLMVKAGLYTHTVVIDVRNGVPPTPTPTPTPTPPTGAINLGAYANGTDMIDDTVQIRNAIAAAASQGKALYVPAGKYRHGESLSFNTVNVIGDGPTSEFVATNYRKMCLFFTGLNPKVQKIKHSVNVSGIVWTAPSDHNHCSIVIMFATNALVDGVTVDGAGKIGIANIRSSGTRILNSFVARSLKDGIHNENGCTNAEIAFCEVADTGDDMISVVSYDNATTEMNRDINIHDNYVHDNYFARGITVVGGENVRITNNRITNSRVSGLYIWSEDSHQTRRVYNVTCEGNILTGCNTDTASVWSAISIGGRSLYSCENVTFRNNQIIDPRRDAVNVKAYVKNIQFIGTKISGVKAGYKEWMIDPSVAGQVSITP